MSYPILSNAFKQAVVGTYSDSATVIELASISDTVGNADFLPDPASGEYNVILYDTLFGNPADANNGGSYEIMRVTSINYGDNEITVTRGQENSTAITITDRPFAVLYGATSKFFTDLLSDVDGKVDKTSDTGSAVIPSGTEAQRDSVPQAGFFRFNTESNTFEGYDGTDWGEISGSEPILNPILITATATDTFDLGIAILKAFVSRNGAWVSPDEFSFDGDDIVFDYNLDADDEIVVYPITTQPFSIGVIDNLTTDDPNQALSAKQGKTLQDTKVAKAGDTLTGLLRATAGINFNASGGDTLDEYEVGTWTPVISADSGAPSYTNQDGNYVRIGRFVIITGRVRFSKNTLSGSLLIGGIPFTSINTFNASSVYARRDFETNFSMIGRVSGSFLFLEKLGTSATGIVSVSDSDAGSNSEIYITSLYITS
jgi:hypothetical protein